MGSRGEANVKNSVSWYELGLEMVDVESSLKSKDGLSEVSMESAVSTWKMRYIFRQLL